MQLSLKGSKCRLWHSFSNQWAFTMLESRVLKYNFLNFYIAKTIVCILLKFVQLTLND